MLKLLMITTLLLAPTHSFAVDLVGDAPDSSGANQTAIELEEILENGRTRLVDDETWAPGEPESGPWGSTDLPRGPSTKIKVTIKNAGTAVGTYTSESMTIEDAIKMVEDSNTLNAYLKKGGRLSINANPSPLELNKTVQKLESSKDPEVLRIFYASKMDKLKTDLNQLKEKYKVCREDRKAAIRERREGKPLPKREVEIRGGLHNGTVVKDVALPPVLGPGGSTK